MSTFSRKQDNNYMDSPRSRSKERKLEKQREKELAKEAAKAKKLARAKERELEREQERQHERERAKEKARLKEQEKIQKFKAKISHPHFDRNSNVDGSRHLSAIIALDSKEHGYLNVQREPERKSQSIHGYQHEYRANVGLGLSTDTIDPTQQREDAAKEFSQEPAPMDSSPEHSPPPPGSRPSAKQRLLHLPSALLTNLPRQRSPSSPSLALNKPWRAVSPRSPTSRSTLPLVAAMTSPSMPSLPILSSHHSSPQSPNMEYPIGILDLEDTLETRPDSLSRRDLSSSSRFSTSSHLSVERPVSIPLPSPNRATLARFMADFESRIWFTYRKDIARIEPSFYTSDAGWGCMMRTGQSLLAQAFVQIMLGRDWRADSSASEESCQKYSTLLSWFADEPDRYYGIHSIAKAGVALDKRVGEWFGPSTVAHALRRLSYKHPDCPVAVVVSMDNTIRISELVHAATGKDNRNAQSDIYGAGPGSPDPQQPQQQHRRQRSGYWKPVVVMMPARYGLDKLKEGYVGNLKQLFKLPQFLGIAGGRPGRSLYFVAYQARATHEEMTHCPSPSYHCNVVRTMDIMELDPSMMLGFLIRSMKDLAELLAQLKHGMDQHYPLFTIIGNPAPAASSASSPTSAPVTVPTLGEKLPVNGASTIVSSPVTGEPSPVQAAYPFETEKEKEKEKEETKSVRIESAVVALERVQLDQGQWSPVKTAVVVEEEENIVPAQETTNKTITTSTTITTTTISTTIRTIPNLDAPLPALPQEQDYAPAPPPPRPLSTSPEEGRPKKEMKRITKAFQKERWMVKPKSNKDKKGGSSPPVEQVPIADRIVYKYASEGDAVVVHDEDTLSVKSFDSDISL
ncbi:Cysteine protease atg4b [Mortierella sp. AD031]|nr:Cysteine protease atg4b [Mortierella sp. AD031]